MIRIRAINEDATSSEAVESTERQEAECFSLYRQAIEASRVSMDSTKAEGLFMQLLEHPLIKITLTRNVSEKAEPEITAPTSHNSSLLKLAYLGFKNLSTVLRAQKRYSESLENLILASEIDGSDVMVWYNIGELALGVPQPNFRLARIALEKALLIHPRHWFSMTKLVDILFLMGDYYSCMVLLDQILHNDPSWKYGKELLLYLRDDDNINPDPSRKRPQKDMIGPLIERASKQRCIRPLNAPSQQVRNIYLEKLSWIDISSLLIQTYESAKEDTNLLLSLITVHIRDNTASDVTEKDDENEVLVEVGKKSTLHQLKKDRSNLIQRKDITNTNLTHLLSLIDEHFGYFPEEDEIEEESSDYSSMDTTVTKWSKEEELSAVTDFIHLHTPLKLIDIMQRLVERISGMNDVRWPKNLSSLILKCQDIIDNHRDTTTKIGWHHLTLAELLFDKSQDITSGGTPETRDVLRKKAMNYMLRLYDCNTHDPTNHKNFIRLLWLRSQYEESMGYMDNALKCLSSCETELINLEPLSSSSVLYRPNCRYAAVISKTTIHSKQRSLEFYHRYEAAANACDCGDYHTVIELLDGIIQSFSLDRTLPLSFTSGMYPPLSSYEWQMLGTLHKSFTSLKEYTKAFQVAMIMLTRTNITPNRLEDITSICYSIIQMLDIGNDDGTTHHRFLTLSSSQYAITTVILRLVELLQKTYKSYDRSKPIKWSQCLNAHFILLYKLITVSSGPPFFKSLSETALMTHYFSVNLLSIALQEMKARHSYKLGHCRLLRSAIVLYNHHLVLSGTDHEKDDEPRAPTAPPGSDEMDIEPENPTATSSCDTTTQELPKTPSSILENLSKKFNLPKINVSQSITQCVCDLFSLPLKGEYRSPHIEDNDDTCWDTTTIENETEHRGKSVDSLYLEYWRYIKPLMDDAIFSKSSPATTVHSYVNMLNLFANRLKPYFTRMLKRDLQSDESISISLHDPLLKDIVSCIYAKLGKYYASKKKTARALSCFKKDVKLNPSHWNSWLELANHYERLLYQTLSSIPPLQRLSMDKETMHSIMKRINHVRSTLRHVLQERQLEIEESQRAEYMMRIAVLYLLELKLIKTKTFKHTDKELEEIQIEGDVITKKKLSAISFEKKRRQYLEIVFSQANTAHHLKPDNWVYPYVMGRAAEKLDKSPDIYLDLYYRAIIIYELSDIYDKDSVNSEMEILQKDRNSLKRSRKENTKVKLVEPFYRLHSSRLKLWASTNLHPTDENEINNIKSTLSILEKYNYIKNQVILPLNLDQVTINDIPISDRKDKILKNIFDAFKFAAKHNKFASHKVTFKLAWIHRYITRKLKKAKSEIQKLVFPDCKELFPKLWIENIYNHDKKRGNSLLDFGKEEKYTKRYLRFFIDICKELKDKKSLEEFLDEIPKLKKNYRDIFASELDYTFSNYLQLFHELLQNKNDGSDSDNIASIDEEEEDTLYNLRRAYMSYLYRPLYSDDNMPKLSQILQLSYRNYIKGREYTELIGKEIEYFDVQIILAMCKKLWPKLQEKRLNKHK